MIDEHIKDGDFIVVHERNQADNGQTVVALVHGSSATVKRFYREPGGWIRLEPANPPRPRPASTDATPVAPAWWAASSRNSSRLAPAPRVGPNLGGPDRLPGP